jgi:EAL domain-containing protein (putative c-di-GMP-specific phosphodiesterase class I)
VRLALEQLPDVPPDVFVSVNVSPDTVARPELPELLRRASGRVVLEVTEHAVAEHHDELAASMAELRRAGARFAVDDVGAGYAGLNHVVRLAPDIIKLDRFLAQGVDEDPARQALASAAAAFAERARTRVIAEGVRTEGEHRCLHELGIRYGQGYHYGRPGPLDEVLAAA